MKKYARLISAVALTMAVIICFSGCGIIDHARSLVKKDDSNSTNTTAASTLAEDLNNENTDTAGNTQVATAPSTEGTTLPSNTDASAQTTVPSTNAGTNTQGNGTNSDITNTETTAPSANEEVTDEKLESLTAKEIQDMLFSTTDPTTAGKILEFAGFEYDAEQGIYYSQMNPLQRKFGFNFLYDMAAPLAGMNYSTERIEFTYGGKEWMIQLWKGQYGITAGAEIGLYSRDPEKVMQYDCADDEELITMQFDFYNMGEYVFSRGPEKHWWLTGFKVFHIGIPQFITMDMMLDFEDNYMANAFERALKEVASTSFVDPITYERRGSAFYIEW